MDSYGTAERVRRRLGQPDIPHLTFTNEIGHGADGIFDGGVRIDAVQVVKIDDVDTEPSQAAFTRAADVLRFAIHASHSGVRRIADDAKLRGQYDLLAP